MMTNDPVCIWLKCIKSSTEEKLLSMKLSFESHVSSICKKASQMQHALVRLVSYMDLKKDAWLKLLSFLYTAAAR